MAESCVLDIVQMTEAAEILKEVDAAAVSEDAPAFLGELPGKDLGRVALCDDSAVAPGGVIPDENQHEARRQCPVTYRNCRIPICMLRCVLRPLPKP